MAINNAASVSLSDEIIEDIFKFEYTWIMNQSKYRGDGKSESWLRQSPKFYIGRDGEIEGQLELNSTNLNNSGHISFYLKRVLCEDPARQLLRINIQTLALCILRDDYLIPCCGDYPDDSYIEQFGEHDRYISLSKAHFSFGDMKKLACSQKITITCKCNAKVQMTHNPFMKMPVQVSDIQVYDKLGTYLENGKLSDVTLVANGHEYKSHKVVLVAQSPVFSAMFDHEMTEQRENLVKITDIEHDVFLELLHFMYTGKSPNIKLMANDLLAAANKYQVEKLKSMCEEILIATLTIKNAPDILILADLHNADHLKSQTMKFIVMNTPEINSATPGLKSMVHSHPHLFAEVFTALVEQNDDESSVLITVSKNERESGRLRFYSKLSTAGSTF